MSNARKLQTEIDRVMKKVDEGVELFDEIWDKVYSAEQQNQKEKYEGDLKKEIKKLQRLRDQIKTWIGSSDVKDKEPLLDARRLIETKMEQFKICEKETKTKTYSKEGLARQERLDPAEQAKHDTTTWMSEIVERLSNLVDEAEVEIEKLSSGKGKKTNKHLIDDFNHYIAQHKYHISKLEGIIRLVNNDVLDVEVVDPLRDDLEYYLDSYEDEDYQQAYDEEFFYEALGLDELDVVNVDRVTQAAAPTAKKEKDSDNDSKSTKGSKGDKKSKKAVSSVIPLTIGRARTTSSSKKSKKGEEEEEKPVVTKKREPTPTTIPAARPAPPAPAAGTSMAAILKRETEQQEKERQKAEQLRQQQAQAAHQQQQLQQRQQQEAQLRQQQEALRQQQQQQREEAAAKQKALQQQQQQQQALRQQQQQQQEAALKRQQSQTQQAPSQTDAKAPQLQSQASVGSTGSGSVAGLDILQGLGGLSLDGTSVGGGAVAPADGTNYLTALNESFATMPNAADNERTRQYTPQNPYPTPASYPSTPSPIFDNPQIFEKLGTDALFFIFYYAQGTYQQYLAARELKKQSWRFHKKYMTWFQRHEEPKITTDEYEQGTYVYFDYETGWCTRIKQDFRFEYSFLEDSLQ
eukprot:CAMPEP_0176114448 /NCGR_PEP_ID=MMETSP0120_2-20121206/57474_1 /TAXON_ID=160619 /ORGANISM="Kryptoperidinium foliaceum, Strain CCMP 1326" /LENGTH=632 /DNA_ID=CAMNT_0017448681 /DNA_START=168 /DNA_END=2066 /DNA_ORIENTATION=+